MKKIIAFTLSIMMIFSPLYNTATIFGATADERQKEEDNGYESGKYFGITDGYAIGSKNYKDGNTKYKYTRSFKEDLDIRLKSSLLEDELYYYVKGFKKGYEESYIVGYDLGIEGSELNLEELNKVASGDDFGTDGSADGANFGSIVGSYDGTVNFKTRIGNFAEDSLRKFEAEKSLVARFYLGQYSDAYKNDFINAFRSSYISSFEGTYYSLLSNFAGANITYTIFDKDTISGTVNAPDLDLSFEFAPGSFYGDYFVGATRDRVPVGYNTSELNFVDYSFVVDTYSSLNYNRKEYIEPTNEFKMVIPFTVTSDSLGIYEYKYGSWQYLYTELATDSLTHTFTNGYYDGGNYCVFIQPNYKEFTDIHFSPFYNEIYTYARRGAVYSTSDKLNPTSNITRGELAYLINGIINPNDVQYSSKQFTDVSSYSPFNTAISYTSYTGLLNGVSETEFNPNGYITYSQLKTVIERYTKSEFYINSVFTKMQNERFHKSKGASNLNEYVTKEDAIYILNSVLK